MIYKLILGELLENCYIITDNNKNCVIIDAGDGYERIMKVINENNLKINGVLLTHGHFDHCASCSKLQKDGVKIYIHKLDADKLYGEGNLANLFGFEFNKFKADVLFDEGTLKVGDFTFNVIHTPGHSKGSVCFVYKNNVFCGDTIFEAGIGRTDFYDSSLPELMDSLKKLDFYLENDYNFFSGH